MGRIVVEGIRVLQHHNLLKATFVGLDLADEDLKGTQKAPLEETPSPDEVLTVEEAATQELSVEKAPPCPPTSAKVLKGISSEKCRKQS